MSAAPDTYVGAFCFEVLESLFWLWPLLCYCAATRILEGVSR